MSDTAFFVRPAISPATGTEWLRLTDKAPAVSGISTRPRWRLDGIPNLAQLAHDLASGNSDAAVAELSRHLYKPTSTLAHALVPLEQNETALAGVLTSTVLRHLRRRPSRWKTFGQWAPRVALMRGLKEMESESSHLDRLPPEPEDLESLREMVRGEESDSPFLDADGRRIMSRLLARVSPVHRVILTLIEIERWEIADLKSLFGWPKWLLTIRVFLARRSFDRLLRLWLEQAR